MTTGRSSTPPDGTAATLMATAPSAGMAIRTTTATSPAQRHWPMPRNTKPRARNLELHWRWHYGDQGFRRVWRNDWVDDQFEVLSNTEFTALEKAMRRFNIPL